MHCTHSECTSIYLKQHLIPNSLINHIRHHGRFSSRTYVLDPQKASFAIIPHSHTNYAHSSKGHTFKESPIFYLDVLAVRRQRDGEGTSHLGDAQNGQEKKRGRGGGREDDSEVVEGVECIDQHVNKNNNNNDDDDDDSVNIEEIDEDVFEQQQQQIEEEKEGENQSEGVRNEATPIGSISASKKIPDMGLQSIANGLHTANGGCQVNPRMSSIQTEHESRIGRSGIVNENDKLSDGSREKSASTLDNVSKRSPSSSTCSSSSSSSSSSSRVRPISDTAPSPSVDESVSRSASKASPKGSVISTAPKQHGNQNREKLTGVSARDNQNSSSSSSSSSNGNGNGRHTDEHHVNSKRTSSVGDDSVSCEGVDARDREKKKRGDGGKDKQRNGNQNSVHSGHRISNIDQSKTNGKGNIAGTKNTVDEERVKAHKMKGNGSQSGKKSASPTPVKSAHTYSSESSSTQEVKKKCRKFLGIHRKEVKKHPSLFHAICSGLHLPDYLTGKVYFPVKFHANKEEYRFSGYEEMEMSDGDGECEGEEGNEVTFVDRKAHTHPEAVIVLDSEDDEDDDCVGVNVGVGVGVEIDDEKFHYQSDLCDDSDDDVRTESSSDNDQDNDHHNNDDNDGNYDDNDDTGDSTHLEEDVHVDGTVEVEMGDVESERNEEELDSIREADELLDEMLDAAMRVERMEETEPNEEGESRGTFAVQEVVTEKDVVEVKNNPLDRLGAEKSKKSDPPEVIEIEEEEEEVEICSDPDDSTYISKDLDKYEDISDNDDYDDNDDDDYCDSDLMSLAAVKETQVYDYNENYSDVEYSNHSRSSSRSSSSSRSCLSVGKKKDKAVHKVRFAAYPSVTPTDENKNRNQNEADETEPDGPKTRKRKSTVAVSAKQKKLNLEKDKKMQCKGKCFRPPLKQKYVPVQSQYDMIYLDGSRYVAAFINR